MADEKIQKFTNKKLNVKCPKIKVKEIENPQKMIEGNQAGCLIAHKTKPT